MKGKKKSFAWLFWVLLITVFGIIPFFTPGYFPMHDDLQISRLYQMDLCVKDGQIPCRWVPEMGYGYGYPLFNYYPPLPYYSGEIFHLLGLSLINAIKAVFVLGFVLSGIFAFLLGRSLWGKRGGLVVAAFYLFAPYHAVNVYVRGALAEFWGLVFFPAVFWAIYQIVKTQKKKDVVWLAFFYGLLLLSHNLMAVFFTPAAAAWGLFLLWYLKKPPEVLKKLIIGGLWGIGLAAFFVFPVLLERNLVHVETMFIGYFNYLAHFTTLNQLFFSRFWGYGPSTWGPEDGMAFPVGQIHWLAALMVLIVFGLLWLKKKKRSFWLVAFLFVFFLFYTFLTHLRSTAIWKLVPVLAYAQFPWRFLAMSAFFTSVLAGGFFGLLKEAKIKNFLAFFLILGVVLFNLSFFHPEKIIKITDEEKLFSKVGYLKLQTDAIFDYLPIAAKAPPGKAAPAGPWLESGEGEISGYQKGTDWLKFKAEITSSEAKVKIPVFYFPRWTYRVNGQKADFTHENDLGLPELVLNQGEYEIKGELKNTPVRTLGNWLSLFSWLGLAGYVLKYAYARRTSQAQSA